MNHLFRILVAVYSFILAIFFGIVMISPFGDKSIMASILDFINKTFYQSNKYDVLLFVVGLIFLLINIFVLISGLRGRRSGKYLCTETETGIVRISSYSIENVALGLSEKFSGVKDAKAKVKFRGKEATINIRLTALPGVNLPELCKSIQIRVQESVEATMDIPVKEVNVNVDSVAANSQE